MLLPPYYLYLHIYNSILQNFTTKKLPACM